MSGASDGSRRAVITRGGAETGSADERAFSRERLAPLRRKPPVVIVGLPRSGTKYLTHVLNSIEDLYVFDDLYYFREARGIGASGRLRPDQFEHLVNWLAARSMPEKREQYFIRLQLSADDVLRLKESVSIAFRGSDVGVQEPLEEWMVRLAMIKGCNRWGYKAPQEFMYLDYVESVFPGVQFIFIYRDPRSMMGSYKYVPERYGAARQYHPITYALYWRLAQRLVSAYAETRPIYPVKFEDLTERPAEIGAGIAHYLGHRWTQLNIPEKVNTSFTSSERRGITPTEKWICERIAGDAMQQVGYELDRSPPQLRDVPDLIATTFRYVVQQTRQLVFKPRNRASAKAFLRRLAGRSVQ